MSISQNEIKKNVQKLLLVLLLLFSFLFGFTLQVLGVAEFCNGDRMFQRSNSFRSVIQGLPLTNQITSIIIYIHKIDHYKMHTVAIIN